MSRSRRPNFGLTYRRHRRKRIRHIRKLAGIGIMVVGLAIMGFVPSFYLYSRIEGTTLINRFHTVSLNKHAQPKVPLDLQFKVGNLIGKIDIPKLNLIVPFLQGTNDAQLAVGVGHLPSSVLPGENGTSILAAHNVTWFHHIDQLRPGDTIELETTYGIYHYQVTGSLIVPNTGVVADTASPTIALEACYPLNALYLTPNRYFVFAKQVGLQGPNYATAVATEESTYKYRVTIPSQLEQEGITLKDNSLPMGSLSYSGSPSNAYRQSTGPLNASAAVAELYLAWIHANADHNITWMKQIGGKKPPTTFYGISLSRYHYDSLFDVKLHVVGDKLETLEATTDLTITHTFHVVIYANNVHGEIKIDSIIIERD